MTKVLKKPKPSKRAGKGSTEIVLVTADTKVLTQVRSAIGKIPEVKLRHVKGGKKLLPSMAKGRGFLLLDDRLPDWNSYELCRRFKGTTKYKVFMLLRQEDRYGHGISRFCGADGILLLPLKPEELQNCLQTSYPEVQIDQLLRKSEKSLPPPSFADSLLKDAMGEEDRDLIEAIVDPETKLFNYAFLTYKLDEEFKRATRFKYPLACLMLGFDGEASAEVLLELAGIFLTHSRDTDVLGRFDLNSFLFLLPNTGLGGGKIMAERVLEAAKKKKLKDLVGEPLDLSVGISYCPHSRIVEREDLFEASRTAFESARRRGGGIEIADGKF